MSRSSADQPYALCVEASLCGLDGNLYLAHLIHGFHTRKQILVYDSQVRSHRVLFAVCSAEKDGNMPGQTQSASSSTTTRLPSAAAPCAESCSFSPLVSPSGSPAPPFSRSGELCWGSGSGSGSGLKQQINHCNDKQPHQNISTFSRCFSNINDYAIFKNKLEFHN